MGYLCDNIGLALACLPSGTTGVTGSPSCYMTQPSGIPILSPVLFMHVGDPYIPPFYIRRIFDLLVLPPFLVSLRHVYYSKLIILTHFLFPPSPPLRMIKISQYMASFVHCICLYCYILSFNNLMAVYNCSSSEL